MALNSIYSKYFQKSKVFVYPLLGIARGSSVIPIETYFSWKDMVESEDKKLVCLYPNRKDEEFKSFNKSVLMRHTRLDNIYEIDDDNIVYVFDFNDLGNDWEMIIEGKYSKISKNLKHDVLKFFKNKPGNYTYMESYLFPEKYFRDYSDILAVPESLLKSVGELCPIPDSEREHLTLDYVDLGISKNTLSL